MHATGLFTAAANLSKAAPVVITSKASFDPAAALDAVTRLRCIGFVIVGDAFARPLLDALELLHRGNCVHRDVSPDNIMLLAGEAPVLLDFGAARRVIGDATQALTVILKPGYAPIEQYDEIPGMKQGPWTDIYALAGVLHFAITGKPPVPSVGRLVQDTYQPLGRVAAGLAMIWFSMVWNC